MYEGLSRLTDERVQPVTGSRSSDGAEIQLCFLAEWARALHPFAHFRWVLEGLPWGCPPAGAAGAGHITAGGAQTLQVCFGCGKLFPARGAQHWGSPGKAAWPGLPESVLEVVLGPPRSV